MYKSDERLQLVHERLREAKNKRSNAEWEGKTSDVWLFQQEVDYYQKLHDQGVVYDPTF
jgi:hypothetical protein